jgi:hypothetical protein
MTCGCVLLSSVAGPALPHFSTLSYKRHCIRKKLWNTKVFWFSVRYLSKKFLILRRIGRYDQKHTLVFMWSTRFACQILMKLEFSRQISKKYLNIKFHEIPSSRSRVFPRGQMDKRTDMVKLTVAFNNFANAPKNCLRNLSTLQYTTESTHQSKIYLYRPYFLEAYSKTFSCRCTSHSSWLFREKINTWI